VLRAGEWRQKDVTWPFKIVYILDTKPKVHYFSAASEDEMKVWINCCRIIFDVRVVGFLVFGNMTFGGYWQKSPGNEVLPRFESFLAKFC